MSTMIVNSAPATALPAVIDIHEPTLLTTVPTQSVGDLEEDVSQKLLRLVREQFHAIVALNSQVSTLDQLTKSLREELGQMQRNTEQRFAEESAARLDLEGRLSLAMREAAQEVLKQDMNFETPEEAHARKQLESRLTEAMQVTENLKEEFPQLNWGTSLGQGGSTILQPSPKAADDVANAAVDSSSQVCGDASVQSLSVDLVSSRQEHDQHPNSRTFSQKNPLQSDIETCMSMAISDIHNGVDGKLRDIIDELDNERVQRISQHDMFMNVVSRIEVALKALNQEKVEGSRSRNGSQSPRVPSPPVPGPFIPVAQVARPAVLRRISATRNGSQSPTRIQRATGAISYDVPPGVVVNAPQGPSRATLGNVSPLCPPPRNPQVSTCAPYHTTIPPSPRVQRAASQPKAESVGVTSSGCPPMNAPTPGVASPGCPPTVASPRCPPPLNAMMFIPPSMNSQHTTAQGGEVIANLVQRTTSQPQVLVPSLAYPSANAGVGRYTSAPNTNQAPGGMIAHPMSARMSSQEVVSQASLHSGIQRQEAVSQASLQSGMQRQDPVSQGSSQTSVYM